MTASIMPMPSAAMRPAPVITTREQLDALLENVALLHRERDHLRHAQESELEEVRRRYRAPLLELDHLLEVETGWAKLWAQAHREAFAAGRALEGPHATIGFRAEPPRLERASRRWNWTRIAGTLAGLSWGRRYLRTPAPEVDKDAIMADLAAHLPGLSAEELRTAGIRVVEGEKFYVTPHTSDASDIETVLAKAA